MSRKQKTVRESVSWSGIGLHSGKSATVTVGPADENFGIKFQSLSHEDILIKADVRWVSSTHRSTNIRSESVEIATIEHLMAALYAVGITNALVTVEGEELPILDGSAAPYVDKLSSQAMDQGADVLCFDLKETVTFRDEVSGAEYVAIPSDHYSLEVLIDFDQKEIGQKHASYSDDQEFNHNIGSARTFVFTHEVIQLAQSGLIKGGSIDNAIVLKSDNASQDQFREALVALNQSNPQAIIDQVNQGMALHFDNEPARHKLLDLYGDLALLGANIKAKIIAKKPGHTGNIAFVKELKEIFLKQQKLQGIPQYDPNVEPIFDIIKVSSMLPHRYPFLLVDKIIELSDTHVVGVKNVTVNENFFPGHFPNNPVFPGVLQMEALAQTGGILALTTVNNPADFDTYFLKLDNVKFKRKVLPGDTLLLKMELLAPIRRGIVQMKGTIYVGNQIASEGELTAQIIDRNKVK